MKIKTALLAGAALFAAAVSSQGATFLINNVVNGTPGDTLFANSSGSLMNGGVVAFGYFNTNLAETSFDTNVELFAQLGNFVTTTTAAPGSASADLGASRPGYIQQPGFTQGPAGVIPAGSPLAGRLLYLIVSDAASLAAATPDSEFAVVRVGTLFDDSAGEQQYYGNPTGAPVVLGSLGTFTGNASGINGGEGTYTTLQLSPVPEPSAVLLGAVGALGLLRRRRN